MLSACRVVASALPRAPARCVPTPPRRSRAAGAPRSRSSCPAGSRGLFLPQRLLAVSLTGGCQKEQHGRFCPQKDGVAALSPRDHIELPWSLSQSKGWWRGVPRGTQNWGELRSGCPRSIPAPLGTSRWRISAAPSLLGQGWEPWPLHPAASRVLSDPGQVPAQGSGGGFFVCFSFFVSNHCFFGTMLPPR